MNRVIRPDLLKSLIITACLITSACSAADTGNGSGPPTTTGVSDQRLFGAYVSPQEFTQEGRIRALVDFEELLGKRLDVVQNFYKWDAAFPRPFDHFVIDRGSLLLVSWAGTDPETILSGRHDPMIRERARALRALNKRILLRWRWEMNRPNLQAEIGSPSKYVAAWKHIRSIFRAEGASLVEWVWCPSANNFVETRGAEYFPGDDQVDWLCADAYTATPDEPLSSVLEPFINWAAKHNQPIIIGEFGTHPGAESARAHWLNDARAYLDTRERVRGIVYFESANAPNGRYDLTGEPSALAAYRAWVRGEKIN